MTKVPVDEVPAGPALDAAVAEALGWEQKGEGFHLHWEMPTGETRTWEDTSFRSFRPSTDIAAAWELWSRLCADWFYAKLIFVRDLSVKANLYRDAKAVRYADPTVTATGQNGYLAICRAFLEASGVTHVEVPE